MFARTYLDGKINHSLLIQLNIIGFPNIRLKQLPIKIVLINKLFIHLLHHYL